MNYFSLFSLRKLYFILFVTFFEKLQISLMIIWFLFGLIIRLVEYSLRIYFVFEIAVIFLEVLHIKLIIFLFRKLLQIFQFQFFLRFWWLKIFINRWRDLLFFSVLLDFGNIILFTLCFKLLYYFLLLNFLFLFQSISSLSKLSIY